MMISKGKSKILAANRMQLLINYKVICIPPEAERLRLCYESEAVLHLRLQFS